MGSGLEGWNDDGSGRQRLPIRRLVQGTSRIEGMPDARKGYFVDPKEKREIGKSMDAVVLSVATTRKLFWDIGNKDGKKGVRCWSADGIVPSPSLSNPVSAICEGCEYQNKDVVAVLSCYDLKESKDANEPITFALEAKSTGLNSVRHFVRAVQKQKLNARDFQLSIEAKAQENDKGAWHTFEFTNVEKLPANLKADIEAAYEAINGDNRDDGDIGAPDEAIPF